MKLQVSINAENVCLPTYNLIQLEDQRIFIEVQNPHVTKHEQKKSK
jgi:hypothetical protein